MATRFGRQLFVMLLIASAELAWLAGISSAANITSTGHDGRQMFVEASELNNPGPGFRFFPPNFALPIAYPDPTPSSPAQDSILLTSDMRLTVVIPKLQHFPMFATIDIDYEINGFEITVNATMHLEGATSNTIYGPHEYLLPIGNLDPGNYRLNFHLERSPSWQSLSLGPDEGPDYILFTVVPEPSGIMLLLPAVVALGAVAVRARGSRIPRP